MITIERSRDWALIRSVMVHPQIYPHISDDFAPTPDEYEVAQNEAIFYLAAKDDAEFLGLFAYLPQNSICWEVHTCLLPNAWGPRATGAAKESIRWIFANTACQRIVTNVPARNRLALRFAKRAGLLQYGFNPRSYPKHGQLVDQILLGISKG